MFDCELLITKVNGNLVNAAAALEYEIDVLKNRAFFLWLF